MLDRDQARRGRVEDRRGPDHGFVTVDADFTSPQRSSSRPRSAGSRSNAEVAEFGRRAIVTANGVTLQPDSLGRAPLCAPCRAGARLAISIVPQGQWWDAPRIRARDIGWTEIRDGAEWARYFTGDSTLAIPDSVAAMALLRGALDPSKTAYHAEIAEWLARLAPSAARIRRDTIDIVGHSHIDAAWRWRVRDGRDAIQATWESATKLMAKYPDMHFTGSSAQYYEWIEEQDPALLSRLQTLAREHRWDPVGGWWVESDANLPSGESLVRQALYGQRTFVRLFGKPARVAWLVNSFGFPWSLPQILRKSGFEYFVTQENAVERHESLASRAQLVLVGRRRWLARIHGRDLRVRPRPRAAPTREGIRRDARLERVTSHAHGLRSG